MDNKHDDCSVRKLDVDNFHSYVKQPEVNTSMMLNIVEYIGYLF